MELSGFSHGLPRILSCCSNIRKLHVKLDRQPNDSIREMCRLNNLRRLFISVREMDHCITYVWKIMRNCHQLELLETIIEYPHFKILVDVFEPGPNIQRTQNHLQSLRVFWILFSFFLSRFESIRLTVSGQKHAMFLIVESCYAVRTSLSPLFIHNHSTDQYTDVQCTWNSTRVVFS